MEPFPESAFPRLLADLWRERGWEARVASRDDGTHLVGGERGGVRGLMLVLPDPDTEVRTAHLRAFVTSCRKRGVDVAVVATQGSFTGEVRRVASERGVHLLDRERLEKTIRKGGFEAVAARHRDGDHGDGASDEGASGDDDGANSNAAHGDEGWVSKLRAALPDATPDAARGAVTTLRARAASDPRRLVAVVVAVAVLTSGVVIGVSGVPGGDGTGGHSTDIAVSAVSTATPAANESLVVRWNAATRPTLDSPHGAGTFDPPPNETFVVVRLDVRNGASEAVMFGGATLIFESDGVRYGSQPLSGANLTTTDRFTPGDVDTVWAVFSVPANATTGTVLVRNGLVADGPGVRFVHDPSLAVEFDAPSASNAGSSGASALPAESLGSSLGLGLGVLRDADALPSVGVRRSLSLAVPFSLLLPFAVVERAAAVARGTVTASPTQILNRPRP